MILLKNESPYDLSNIRVEEILQQIRNKIFEKVDHIYLFGSVARGDFSTQSDIDLILIKETNIDFVCRSLEFVEILNIFPRIDIFVYTKEEFAKIQLDRPKMWGNILKEMKILK